MQSSRVLCICTVPLGTSIEKIKGLCQKLQKTSVLASSSLLIRLLKRLGTLGAQREP